MTDNENKVLIDKRTLLALLKLISLAAFSQDFELNAIGRDVELGINKECQGTNFSHESNYKDILDKIKRLFEVNRLLFVSIPNDGDVTLEERIDYIITNKKFDDLIKYYGSDLTDRCKFD